MVYISREPPGGWNFDCHIYERSLRVLCLLYCSAFLFVLRIVDSAVKRDISHGVRNQLSDRVDATRRRENYGTVEVVARGH